ncbi:tachykinin-like peptides receptor 86C [Saccoglossus kowalevskii]
MWTDYNVSYYDYQDIEMSFELQSVLTFAFSFTMLLSIVGNLVVIIVILRGRSKKSDVNIFLVNLAVADLITAIVSMPFTFTTLMYGHWIYGTVMCPTTLFVVQVTVCVSIYTLTAIGIDRYYAVVHPLKLRVTKNRNIYVIMSIWLISAVSGIVQLIMARTRQHYWDGEIIYSCSERWPDEASSAVYEVFVMSVTYVIPLLILSYTYFKVGSKLWGRQLPGNADRVRDQSHYKTKRKVIKMLVVFLDAEIDDNQWLLATQEQRDLACRGPLLFRTAESKKLKRSS